jgi:hypothetical protein
MMGEDRSRGAASHRDEIVRLCEGYSITSEFASMIVLENDAEYRRWKIDRRNATRVVRDRRAQEAVRVQLELLRRQTAQKIGPKGAVTPNAQEPSKTILAANASDAPTPNFTGAREDATQTARSAAGDGASGGDAGGAIDPVTAAVAAALAGLGFACRRRRASEAPRG